MKIQSIPMRKRAGFQRVAMLLLAFVISVSSFATDFLVTNGANAGVGSLRQAILSANADVSGTPLTISFAYTGNIAITTSLPTITKKVTIDGGNAANVFISGPGGDNTVALFVLGAGSGGSIIKNFTIRNTGLDGVRLAAATTGTTLENLIITQTGTHYLNRGILANAAQTNLTIRNVDIRNVQDAWQAIYFADKVNNLQIDGLKISGGAGTSARGIHFQGIVTGLNLTNSLIDLDDPATTDDGDYGLFFVSNASNVTIDNTIFRDNEIQGIYVAGTATNFTITNSTFDNLDGHGSALSARFIGNTNTLTITGNKFYGDQRNVADDADYALYLPAASNQKLTITDNKFYDYDLNAIRIGANHANNHDDVLIKGNEFLRNGSGGQDHGALVFLTRNTTSDGAPVLITENIFRDNHGVAVGVYPANGVVYTIPNLTISKNSIYNNKGTQGAIDVRWINKIVITQNSIYNNTATAFDVANGANCGYELANRPVIVSSTETAAGVYNVVVKMPTLCGANACSLELFASNASTTGNGGQHYINTYTGLGSGNRTLTGVTAPAIAALNQAPFGFWSATLKLNNNCGTSEYSNRINVKPTGPAGVSAGIQVWLKPDDFNGGNMVANTGWQDASGNNRHFNLLASDPASVKAGINFNNYVNFDGNDYLYGSTYGYVTAFTGGEAITVLRSASNNVQRGFPYDFGGTPRGIHYTWSDANIYTSFGTNDRLGWNPMTRAVTDVKPNTSITGVAVNPLQWNIFGTYGAPGTWGIDFNGGQQKAVSTTNTPNFTLPGGREFIGYCGVTKYAFAGDIAEVILYSRKLSDMERKQVNTYLAIRNGLTLYHDYVASNGVTVLWNYTGNAGYNNSIAGLMRDDLGIIQQRQSTSVSLNDGLTMALGDKIAANNADNEYDLTNNNAALIRGHNNLAATYTVAVTSTNATARFARVWKVQKTNFDDNQEVTIRLVGATDKNYLLISNTADFAAVTHEVKMNKDGTVRIPSSYLANGSFFTFGRQQFYPGGVTNGLATWMRADEGVSMTGVNITKVDDQGPSQRVWSKMYARTLNWNNTGYNYNPFISFPNNEHLNTPVFASAFTNAEVFSVQSSNIVRDGSAVTTFSFPWQLGGNTAAATAASYRNSTNAMWLNFGSTTRTVLNYGTKNMALPVILNVAAGANKWSGSIDGRAYVTDAANTTSFAGNNYIGAGAAAFFTGSLPETIMYNRRLTSEEKQRVNSYLAVKYGITLDQTTATNYLNSDGTVIWNAAANAGYISNIAAIGRDDIGTLYQKQSRSVNAGNAGFISFATGDNVMLSNEENGDSIQNNKSFFFWSDNNAAVTYTNNVAAEKSTVRMARVWKVNKSNWADQVVTMKMHYPTSNVYLLISSDPTFATIDQEVFIGTSGVLSLNSADIPNGSYFTFAKELKGPGFVNGGVQFWVRADDGTASGALWNDFSGNDFNAVQNTGGLQPTVNTNSLNFNPGMVLDGADDYMDFPGNAGISGSNQFTIVSVATRKTVGTTDLILGQASNATNAMGYGYNANKFFLTATTTGSVTSTSNSTTPGIPMLQGVTRTTSNLISLFSNGAADGATTPVAAWPLLTNNLRIGMRVPSFTDQFGGDIHEIAVYNKVLNAAELLQVNSYLALKYGITLNNGTTNYMASDGVTQMWTVSKNTGFTNGIAGLGRDEKTSLHQKQSRSVVDPTITIGLGSAIATSNAENSGEVENMSFFSWASNNGVTSFTVPTTGLPNATARMGRVWKVDRTDWTDQDITIKVAQNGDRYILVNATDPTFGAAGTTEYPINPMTGSVTINTADLPDGAYFTVASKIVGPACVNGNIAAWLRADYGVTPGNWSDFSGNQKSGTQATAANQPAQNLNSINFNPGLTFNGTSHAFNIPANVLNAGNNNYSIIAVTKPTDINEKQVLFLGAAVLNQGILLQYNNNAGAGGLATIEASWTSNGFWGGATAINKTDLFTSTYSTTLGRRLRQDGVQVASNADVSLNYTPTIGTIGSNNGSLWFKGDIAELIVYNNKALATDELQRVESYLALKYGITMGGGLIDYLASNGTTTMWNATDNAGYNYRITGIGRDDCTELYQKQSINANGGIITLSAGERAATNIENLNPIDNNDSYFVIGDNNLSIDFNTEIDGLNDLTARMARVWKADKTNWADGDVQFKLNNGNEKVFLVVSADNIFDGTDAAYQLDADGNVTVATTEIPDGAYFTFAKALRGPGNVNVGVNLWVRADDGISSNEKWTDYSGNDNDATQTDGALQPALTTGTTNYNPGFVFNGTNQNMSLAVSKLPTGTAPRTMIGVGTSTDLTGTRYIIGWGAASGSNYNSIVNVGNALVYSGYTDDVVGAAGTAVLNMPQEMMGTWAGGTNAPATLYSKGYPLGTVNKSWNTGTAGGAFIGKLSTNVQYWKGPINEVAVYNRVLAGFERQRISSYLAMKYGYTMDQTSNTNYVATDWDGTTGTTYWNATANATYKNNITGIGRDDKTGLDQKQSRNTNTVANGNMVAIGLNTIAATNEDNTAAFTDDLSFLVWGDDGASGVDLLEHPDVLDPGNCSKITRLKREWKVQKTGTVDVVQLNMYLAGLVPSSTSISDLKLLVNKTSDFTEATTQVINAASYDAASQTVTFSNLNLENGDYFTLVTDLTNEAPGGVKNQLYTWYRADKGVVATTTVSRWADQSSFGRDVTQATAGAQPAYNTSTKLFNFNPSLTFNGTNNVLSNAAVSLNAATNGEDVFAVILPRAGDFVGLGRATAAGAQQFARFGVDPAGLVWVSRTTATTATSLVTSTNPVNSIVLANFNRNNAGAGSALLNGTTSNSGTMNYYPAHTQLNIGARRFNDGTNVSNDVWYNGEIAEVAIFNQQLTPAERERVASYFGIKYGLTLGHNYVDPDGNELWNITTNSGYNFNITGIGRDDCNGMHQKQSRSVNGAEALVTLGNGMGIVATNVSNANDMNNKSALILGDNNANRTTWTSTNAPADRKRIARTWKVQETNSVSSVTLQVPSNASGATVKLPLEKAGKMYLLVSSTSDFTGTVNEVPMSLNGDVWEASYDFNTGEFFTFATGGDCVDNQALLTTYNTTTAAAADKCYVDGWILFKDPVNAERYIAGIYDPTALIDRSKITASINVNTPFVDLGKGNTTQASRLMRRMLQINCTDCYDAVANPAPGFTVRMFYTDAEKGDAETTETNNITDIKTTNGITDAHKFTWFKASNFTVAQVLAKLTPAGIGAAGQEWADGALVTGTIDGVEYVDFDGVSGFSTFGGIWTVNVNQVLPVSWGQVKAEPVKNQQINISWTTTSEYNNHHFEVERSEGNGVFTVIATVGGKGTTTAPSNYSVDDKNVVPGIVYSYRIKQVDIDGRPSHSKIVTARLNNGNGKTLQIRPNPVVSETLQFDMTVGRQSRLQASILDAAGKLLANGSFRTEAGTNNFKMSVKKLQPGVYMLKVVMEDGTVYTERFMKK